MTALKIETGKLNQYYQHTLDFLMLNKPLVVVLLLFTTYTAMVVGLKQLPGFEVTFWTLLGGALSAGGAGAINQYIDRDIDQLMKRTRHRPLPAGRLGSTPGLIYGIGSCLLGLSILAAFVNLLSAALSLAGMVYYLFIYSIWLKRLTAYNIIIGGGAGAMPVLVGWAAATGRLDINVLLLFALVFLWTPPHFWAFSLQHQADYARAKIPILPVLSGEKVTYRQILIYTCLLVVLTLLMPQFGIGGSLFFVCALLSGSLFIFVSLRLFLQGGSTHARHVFLYSNMYLAFLFLALILDVLLGR